MAVANNELQILWATADSKSVAAAGGEASDAIAFSATAFAATITLKADSAGPADGDTIEFYLLLSAGDPDGAGTGAGGSEYPADDTHGIFLAILDTYTPGEDPAIATVAIPVSVACKIYAKSNASSNAITVSACINEKTA